MQASAADDAALVKSAARLRKKAPGSLLSVQEKTQDEVAQNSYSVFKETREELLQRLLDPQLSLEDTARILNVCPTTVRRYTNRGLLKHVRTAGNQRRFRLSDVLSFMETHMGGVPEIGN
jgi:excisionase family DNA binding protein